MAKFWLTIYIFCFLFAPPLIPGINFSFILGGITLCILLIKYPKRLVSFLKKKNFIKVISLLGIYTLLFLFAYFLGSMFKNQDVSDNFLLNLYSIFLNFVITFICGIYLVFKCEDLEITRHELIKFFIYAGLIQFAIAMFALVNPAFREWTIKMMTKETNAGLMSTPWLLERRFYGLSNNLLDLFGFGMGIIAAMTLFYASAEDKKKFLLATPLLLVVSVLNSRTGILIFAIGLIVWFIGLIVLKKIKITKIILYSVSAILVTILGIQLISHFSPHTLDWIQKDFKSFIDPNATDGTATEIYSDNFWALPEGYQVLVGSGHNASAYSSYRVEDQVHTDNGYVNEIWKVGIIGLIVYMLLNFFIIKQSYVNENERLYKIMYIFFGISMVVFLVKGSLVGYNPGNVIIYTLFLYSIAQPKELKHEKK